MAWPGSKNSGDEIFPVDFQFDSFSDVGTPAAGDKLLVYDVSAGTYKYALASTLGGGGGGEANTASNVGSGADIFKQKTSLDLVFRGVLGINGLSAAVNSDNVEVTPALAAMTEQTSPAVSDWVLSENNAGGTFRKVQIANIRKQTTSLGLSINDLDYPGTDLTSAVLQPRTSSATTPKPRWLEWLYSVNDYTVLRFRLPPNYASGLTLKAKGKMTAANTTDNIQMRCRVAAVSSTDTSINAKAFSTANDSGNILVPDTAGNSFSISLTLTNDDGAVASVWVCLLIGRIAAVSSEATGDIELYDLDIEGVLN